jgi:hypothetical protein
MISIITCHRSPDSFWTSSLELIRRECGTNVCATSIVAKWQWIIAQLAQYCVDVRIKTPFGKALETFLQFESMFSHLFLSFHYSMDIVSDEIRRLAKLVTPGALLSPISQCSEEKDNIDNIDKVPPINEWMRVRMLLDFIETLDKMMYNAYEGAVVSPAHVSKVDCYINLFIIKHHFF